MKKTLSIFVILCIILNILPMRIMAEEMYTTSHSSYNIWVGGVQVTDDNKDDISGMGISGNISYDPYTSTLTLNDATINTVYEKTKVTSQGYTEEYQYGIYADITNLKMAVKGENTINNPDENTKFSYGVYTTGALEIDDTGSIYANSGKGNVSYGIYSNGELTIKSGTITGISDAIYTSIGIYGNKINIMGGDINAYSSGGSAYSVIANSYNITGGKVTVTGKNGLSANFNTNPINISGGEVNANVSGNAISGALNFKGGSVIAIGNKALNGTLNLIDGIVTVSTNMDGSYTNPYDESNLANYKYLKLEPIPDTTVTNLNLTEKLTPPAIGEIPESTIADEQYSGTIVWSENPTIFLGSTTYTATITLTANIGYTFSGVNEGEFSHNGAINISNEIGSGNTITITIVFPPTMEKSLQQISITTVPIKTTYYYGETFDKTGMIVKASYDDGTIDENFTEYTVDKTEPLILSDTLITLTADGTDIKTTQTISVMKKIPTLDDLVYDLKAVDYDSTEKPLSVIAKSDKTLGQITVKYNGSTVPPANADIYSVAVDIAENTEYNGVADLYLGSYMINKIDYKGDSTLSENIFIDGKIGASLTLPNIPEGANYGTPIADGMVLMTDMSILGNTLTYTAPKGTTGQSGTINIPVTDATNYTDYNIVVTITYTDKTPQIISYKSTTIAKVYGDTKFINPLTQTTVKGTINYTIDDTSVATVNPSTGEVTIISAGDGSAVITATASETTTHAQAATSYTLNVSKKALTIKADDKNMTQNDKLPNFTFTVIGLVNNDTITTPPAISTAANGGTTGTFDIIPSNVMVKNSSSYDISYVNGVLTVLSRKSDTPIIEVESYPIDINPAIITPPVTDKQTAKQEKNNIIDHKQETITFTDITTHWAKEDIEFAISHKLLTGTSDTTFSPNTAMTREVFVTALGHLADADISLYTKSSFRDVENDAPYMKYIEWANKNNIIDGIGNYKFAPNQPITREQMAVIITNYAKALGYTLPKLHTENIFSDNDKVSYYAKEAIRHVQMAGIITGKDGNFFDPKGVATRAEVSAVLKRFMELVISNDKL